MSPLLKLPGGSLRDEIRLPLFDTIDILPTSTPLGIRSFFSTIQTPAGANKGKSMTNLQMPGTLPTATSFRLQGLALDAQNIYWDNRHILPLMMEHSAVEVEIGEKLYWKANATFLTGRIWQNAAVAIPAAAEAAEKFILQRYGEAAVAPVVLLGKHSVDINPVQHFKADMTTENMSAAEQALAVPAADTKTRLIFSFKGLQRRGVQ